MQHSSALHGCHAAQCLVQVESALQVQKLKPTIDAIKAQYGDDKKAIQRETTALYESSGVNPSAGRAAPMPFTDLLLCNSAGYMTSEAAQGARQGTNCFTLSAPLSILTL